MAVTKDDIVVRLLLDEAEALKSLDTAIGKAETFQGKIAKIADFAEVMGKKFGVSAQAINDAFRAIGPDTSMALSKEMPSLFSQKEVEVPGGFMLEKQQLGHAVAFELTQRKQVVAELKKQEATQKKITAEEKKSADLATQRKNTLTQTVQLRQQEINAIKGQGTYLQQVANTEKLINDLVEQTGSNAAQVGSELKNTMGMSDAVVNTALGRITQKAKGFAGVMKDVFGNIRNYMSTAFGTFMAMVLFQAQMMVGEFFKSVLQQAKDFGNSLQKLKLAEQVMSEAGMEVTNKQIVEMIDNLSMLYKTVSAQEIRTIFADIALKMKDANLSLEQLQGITQVILDLKIRNPEQDLASIADVVTRAVLTQEQKALTNLGLTTGGIGSEKELLAYAKLKGLVDDTTEKLSEQESIQARTIYILEKANELRAGSLEQQNALVNAGDRLSASWKNFLEVFTPFVNYWNAALVLLSEFLNWFGKIISAIRGGNEELTIGQTLIVKLVMLSQSLSKAIQYLIPPLLLVNKIWQSIFDLVSKVYETITGKKIGDELDIEKLKAIDTPTGTPTIPSILPDEDEEEKKAKKIRDNLRDLAETLDEFGDKAREAQEDFNLIWAEGGRAWQDYERDVWEINRDANEKMAEENAKHRKNEIDAEQKFLEKLRQLREKFLFSLEDALRERDARQVIRLTKQYEMDKAALLREEELRKQRAADDAAERQKELSDDTAKRLEQLAYEFNTKKQRAAEDHAIEMARLQADLDDRLRAISNNLAEELELNAEGAEAIYKELSRFFGPNGNIDKIIGYTYESMLRKTDAAFANIMNIYDAYKKVTAEAEAAVGATARTPVSSNSSGGRIPIRSITPRTMPDRVGMAEGGAVIANSPTDIRFGEAGGEAMFVPLSKLSSMFAAKDRPSGMGSGKLDVRVTLSPDLRTEIVNQSMDEFAGVLQIVQREQ